MKARVGRQFLARLAEVLGPASRPIIVTDAGFHNPWLRAVSEYRYLCRPDHPPRRRGNETGYVDRKIHPHVRVDGKVCPHRLDPGLPEGERNGLLDGVPAKTKRTGWSDTFVRLAVNLYGAPARRGKEFAAWQVVAFFTEHDEFFDGNVREQKQLYFMHTHLV
jgi:hypothetical protein